MRGMMRKIILPASLLLFTAVTLLSVGCNDRREAMWGTWWTSLSIFGFICMGFIFVIFVLLFVLWIIALVDCAKRKNEDFPGGGENSKTVWLVILVVTWVVGFWWVAGIVYYFVVMKKVPQKK